LPIGVRVKYGDDGDDGDDGVVVNFNGHIFPGPPPVPTKNVNKDFVLLYRGTNVFVPSLPVQCTNVFCSRDGLILICLNRRVGLPGTNVCSSPNLQTFRMKTWL
jgi:hypothetical protein